MHLAHTRKSRSLWQSLFHWNLSIWHWGVEESVSETCEFLTLVRLDVIHHWFTHSLHTDLRSSPLSCVCFLVCIDHISLSWRFCYSDKSTATGSVVWLLVVTATLWVWFGALSHLSCVVYNNTMFALFCCKLVWKMGNLCIIMMGAEPELWQSFRYKWST